MNTYFIMKFPVLSTLTSASRATIKRRRRDEKLYSNFSGCGSNVGDGGRLLNAVTNLFSCCSGSFLQLIVHNDKWHAPNCYVLSFFLRQNINLFSILIFPACQCVLSTSLLTGQVGWTVRCQKERKEIEKEGSKEGRKKGIMSWLLSCLSFLFIVRFWSDF
jgi:hypothetical protein